MHHNACTFNVLTFYALLVWYNELGIVHCIIRGTTGYIRNCIFFIWKLFFFLANSVDPVNSKYSRFMRVTVVALAYERFHTEWKKNKIDKMKTSVTPKSMAVQLLPKLVWSYKLIFTVYPLKDKTFMMTDINFLFLLLYVPSQQLWSLRDGQFT